MRATAYNLAPDRRLPAPCRWEEVESPPPGRGEQSRRRRARITMAWGLAVFVAAQAALSLAVASDRFALHDPIFAHKRDLLRKHPAFYATGDRPDTVLMVGSSRTLLGLRAGRLGDALTRDRGRPAEAFNFGIAAAGPLTHSVYLRRLLDGGARPALVLIEVMPPFLAGQTPLPAEARWLFPDRLQAHEFAPLADLGYAPEPIAMHGWAGWAVPCYGHRAALLAALGTGIQPLDCSLDANGCTAPDGTWAGRDGRPTPEQLRRGVELAQRQYAEQLHGFRLGGPGAAALRDLVGLCRREGLPAALVLMPEGAPFRDWYTPQARAEIDAFVTGLAREFGAGLIDARDWVADDGFNDGHHLTGEGAAVFTDRLATELQPLMRQPGGG